MKQPLTKQRVFSHVKALSKVTCPIVLLFYVRLLRKIKSKDRESLEILEQTLSSMREEVKTAKKLNKNRCSKCPKFKEHKLLDKIDRKKNLEKLVLKSDLN